MVAILKKENTVYFSSVITSNQSSNISSLEFLVCSSDILNPHFIVPVFNKQNISDKPLHFC